MTATTFPLEATPAEAQAAIAEEFAFFGDWSERYQYLIDLGRKLPDFPEDWKTEEHRLLGCQSKVWIVPSGDAAKLDFAAASDSAIVSGLRRQVHGKAHHAAKGCRCVFVDILPATGAGAVFDPFSSAFLRGRNLWKIQP